MADWKVAERKPQGWIEGRHWVSQGARGRSGEKFPTTDGP
jgi:hypothetical protein